MTSSSINIIDDAESTNKDYSWNEEALDDFRRMIASDKTLYCPMDDIFLLSFLRARKFDKERSFTLLKNYYAKRKYYSDIFGDFTPSSIQKYLDSKSIGYMENTNDSGRIIMIMKSGNQVHVKETVKCLLMFLDMLLTTHTLQVNGLSLIVDMKGLNLRSIFDLTPGTAYEIVSVGAGSYQCRWKEIHFLNMSRFIHLILQIFMPFTPYKIKKRMYFHSSGMELLHKFISPKYLPIEYGGELIFNPEKCNQTLVAHEQFFKESQKYWNSEENKVNI